MAVLVTGGAGYIGSHMVLELLDAGETVIVLDDLSTGFEWAVPAGAPLIRGDFGDSTLVAKLATQYGVQEIIHFAAKTVVPESVAEPLRYYDNNTAKALRLIECALDAGVRSFVFSSTAAVYGEPRGNPVTEEDPTNPVSPYGRSKLMVEWMLQDVSRARDFRYAALRYFNVAGADPSARSGQSTPGATHLIKAAVQAALGLRREMHVYGADYPTPDGTCLRDYIQVSDLARAHMDALRYLRSGGESLVCNCGYGHGHSVLEVIGLVKDVSGVDFPVRIAGRRPGDTMAVVAGIRRIRETLGWRPQHDDLRSIVRQAFEWERRLLADARRGAAAATPTARDELAAG